jgi:hypothetical protein
LLLNSAILETESDTSATGAATVSEETGAATSATGAASAFGFLARGAFVAEAEADAVAAGGAEAAVVGAEVVGLSEVVLRTIFWAYITLKRFLFKYFNAYIYFIKAYCLRFSIFLNKNADKSPKMIPHYYVFTFY